MNITKIAAVLLIVVGSLGIAYGGFSFTKERHTADLGPLQLSIDEKERVSIPLWAGIGALVVGGLLLVSNKKL